MANVSRMATTPDHLDRVTEPIRHLMREGRYSINGLADATDIPYSTLRRKLHDGETLTVGDLLRIAAAMGVSPGAVLPRASDFQATHAEQVPA